MRGDAVIAQRVNVRRRGQYSSIGEGELPNVNPFKSNSRMRGERVILATRSMVCGDQNKPVWGEIRIGASSRMGREKM